MQERDVLYVVRWCLKPEGVSLKYVRDGNLGLVSIIKKDIVAWLARGWCCGGESEP